MKEGNRFRIITLLPFLLAALNLVWQFYLFFEQQKTMAESGFSAPCDFGAWVLDRRARIIILLATLTIFSGNMIKTLFGKLLYLAGLFCGLFVYLYWWKESLAKIQALGNEEFVFPRTFYLGYGNYLDISIAAILFGLLLFEIISFAFHFISNTNSKLR